MNKFRVTWGGLTIEQWGEDGQYHPFSTPTMGASYSSLKRHQMKLIEGLMIDAANKMHAEGMKHPDARVFDKQAWEQAMQEAMQHHTVPDPAILQTAKRKAKK